MVPDRIVSRYWELTERIEDGVRRGWVGLREFHRVREGEGKLGLL